jgi:hypothetical protein
MDDAAVEQLLFEGESVEGDLAVGPGRVVVTTHRVLVFRPHGDGANYEHVDRPNVEGVSRSAVGRPRLLRGAIKAGVVGLILAGAGMMVDLDGLFGDITVPDSAGALGVGGLFALMNTFISLFALLDDLLWWSGLALLAIAVVFGAAYYTTRESTLCLHIAGDEDIHVPLDGASPPVGELDAALASGSTASGD